MAIRAEEFMTRPAERAVGSVSQLMCRCEPCNGCLTSYRDGIMFTIEGGSAIAAAIALIFYSPYLAGSLAVTSFLSCCAHGCWRRDARIADMRRLADKIGQDDVELGVTIDKTKKVTQDLRKEGEKVREEGKQLAKEDQVLSQEGDKLKQENQTLKETAAKFQAINAQLSSENTKLQAQVGQLQGIMRDLTAHFQEFNSQNDHLRQNISGLSKEVVHMEASKSALDAIVTKVDKEFAADIAALAVNITAAQRSGQDIIALLNEKNQQSAVVIEQMKASVAQLGQLDQTLAAKAKRLEEMEKEAQRRQGEIEALGKEYQNVTLRLEADQRALAELTTKLQQAHQSLAADQSGLGSVQSGFSAVGQSVSSSVDRMQGVLDGLDRVSAGIDKQIAGLKNS